MFSDVTMLIVTTELQDFLQVFSFCSANFGEAMCANAEFGS